MDILMVVIALALPALMGISLVRLVVPCHTEGGGAIVTGTGILAGLIALPLLMRLVNTFGLGLNFGLTTALMLAITSASFWAGLRQRRNHPALSAAPDGLSISSRTQSVVFFSLITMATLHVVLPAVELLGRPLFAWDTTMHWATKSRAWYGAGEIIPFVPPQAWLLLGGEGVYTDNNATYPITTPLLQAWMSLAIGRWDESLMNLPWFACLSGMGIACYGIARASGISPLVAAVFIYFLMSLPMLNTHVALAGYADIFLAATFTVAVLCFHLWSVERQPWQAILAFGFAVSGLLIKVEGLFWLLAFVPALVVVLLPWKISLTLIALAALVATGALSLLPPDFAIGGHSLESLHIFYRSRAMEMLTVSFWVQGSWNLLAYLLVFLPLLLLAIPRSEAVRCRGIITVLVSVAVMFVFLFAYTRFAAGAIRLTSASRVSMQLMPGFLFLLMLMVDKLVRPRQTPEKAN